MRAHEEADQLSALADGELSDDDRRRVEAHVAGCPECRRILDALRATRADLALLDEPEPSPQDSWAIRAAVRRARSPQRWRRSLVAMGTAAAAFAAVLAVALTRGGGPATDLALQDQAREAAPDALALAVYDRAGIEARARDLAASFAAAAGAAPAQEAAVPAQELPEELRSCYAAIGDTGGLTLLRTEAATFEETPAYLYVFRASDHVEIWVMARTGCTVLLFARAPIP